MVETYKDVNQNHHSGDNAKPGVYISLNLFWKNKKSIKNSKDFQSTFSAR